MDNRMHNRFFMMLATLLFSAAAAAAEPSKGVDFDKLDTNKDGQLSAVEASENDALSGMWTEADQDQNGAIDRAEFSAFEVTLEGAESIETPVE